MNADRLEQLVHKVRAIEDIDSRDAALALVQGVMDLHAEGLGRLMELVAECPAAGSLMDEFADETTVGNLLLLHNLHPYDLEARVRKALERVLSDGAAESVEVRDGLVEVRISGDAELAAATRRALAEAAPDARSIVVELTETTAAGFVPLTQLLVGGVR